MPMLLKELPGRAINPSANGQNEVTTPILSMPSARQVARERCEPEGASRDPSRGLEPRWRGGQARAMLPILYGQHDREALACASYERCHPGDRSAALQRRARFSRNRTGLLRDWLIAGHRGREPRDDRR